MPAESSVRFPVRRRIRLPLEQYRQGHGFFVTVTTHERHQWFARHPGLNEQVVRMLRDTARERSADLYAWCIMPDHLHLLVADRDVVDLVRRIKGRCTPLARRYEPGRRLWQRSFYDHALRREELLASVAAYIFENPVRAGIVETPPEYPWSGSTVWPQWRDFYV